MPRIQFFVLLSALIAAASVSGNAQEKNPLELAPLAADEELSLEELGFPDGKKQEELKLPAPQGQEISPVVQPAASAPQTTGAPLPPFEPAPPPIKKPEQQENVKDKEIEALMLDLAREQEEEKTELPQVQEKESELLESKKDTESRYKWWKQEEPFRNQELPPVIYKKDYEKQNQHLPKAFDLSDLERWLFQSAGDGDVNGTRALLNKGVDPDPRNIYGNTPLIEAALRGHTDTVRLLLARGANPNIQNKLGLTALHVAAYKGNNDLVKALLHMGADPNLKNNQGFTPIEFAATNKHYTVAQTLLNNGAKRTSRFYSGMIHEKDLIDTITHSKYKKGRAASGSMPSTLPGDETQPEMSGQETMLPPGSDEHEDAEILREALGIEPEDMPQGPPLPPSAADMEEEKAKESLFTPATDDKAEKKLPESMKYKSPALPTEKAQSEKEEGKVADKKSETTKSKPKDKKSSTAKGKPLPEGDGEWKQTKTGTWMKVGGAEPPQGIAGIYWRLDNNIWYPLDPNEAEDAKKIEELKKKLGHTNGTPVIKDEDLPKNFPIELVDDNAKLQKSSAPVPSLPKQVIEDMKPTPGSKVVPVQGVGGIWWEEVDGLWQQLDPKDPLDAKKIEELKKKASDAAKKSSPAPTPPATPPASMQKAPPPAAPIPTPAGKDEFEPLPDIKPLDAPLDSSPYPDSKFIISPDGDLIPSVNTE